jgi:1-acyl-sn-glycerol-3-phosphate acyltransferase
LLAGAYLAIAAPWTAVARRLGAKRPRASVGLHRLFCAILRLKVRRFGAPGPAGRLIVANHVSWLDIPALGAIEPMAFLAKREVGASVWTRWLVDLQGVVYVDRARKRCIPAVNAAMARRMASGAPVVLFAEATTSDGVRVLPFRSSHFEAARQARAFVQPVYLDYRRFGGMSATRRGKAKAAWYGDMAFLPSLFAVVACYGVTCDVYYGEPIASDGQSDRKALARRAEAAIRDLKHKAWRGEVDPLRKT